MPSDAIFSRLHEWRIRRAQDLLNDAIHDLRFYHYPSHLRRQRCRIERAQQKLNRLISDARDAEYGIVPSGDANPDAQAPRGGFNTPPASDLTESKAAVRLLHEQEAMLCPAFYGRCMCAEGREVR